MAGAYAGGRAALIWNSDHVSVRTFEFLQRFGNIYIGDSCKTHPVHRLPVFLYEFQWYCSRSHQRCRDRFRPGIGHIAPLDGPYHGFVGACVYCLLIAPREGQFCRVDRHVGLNTCATSQQRGDSAHKCLQQCPCLPHRENRRGSRGKLMPSGEVQQ